MATQLMAGRLMVYHAARMLDEQDPNATPMCAMAKQVATENSYEVCDQALQLHGGYGYLKASLPLVTILAFLLLPGSLCDPCPAAMEGVPN